MMSKAAASLVISVFFLLLTACGSHTARVGAGDGLTACHIIYDAGSSRTRLYIYQETDAGWVKHQGPKTDALADPVRGIRGKTMADAEQVIGDIVRALEDIRLAGPVNKKGQARWPAFDWRETCQVEALSVYASAGMRLAEQLDPAGSALLWKELNSRLAAAAGMAVTTRTLTGYEEGLFAWLAEREAQDDGNFGVTEMGGASLQVTFPCPRCADAIQVWVKDQRVPIYSRSFLGWGQDEAWERFGPVPACRRGAGVDDPEWEVADCAAAMTLPADAIAEIRAQVDGFHGFRWYLSGAFRYMRDTDIRRFCYQGSDSGFEPRTSCFRAVYLREVLDAFAIPPQSEISSADWTLGAVICTDTQCLEAR